MNEEQLVSLCVLARDGRPQVLRRAAAEAVLDLWSEVLAARAQKVGERPAGPPVRPVPPSLLGQKVRPAGVSTRPAVDEWGLLLAQVVSLRSTCWRRSVGCVLADSRGRVLATGYNGVAAGLPHCSEDQAARCPGAGAASGQDLDGCLAVHAEANALLQCRDPDAVATAYCTTSPCVSCAKLLLGSGCRRVVFRERYAHDEPARELFLSGRGDREWHHLPGRPAAAGGGAPGGATVLCGSCGAEVPAHECGL